MGRTTPKLRVPTYCLLFVIPAGNLRLPLMLPEGTPKLKLLVSPPQQRHPNLSGGTHSPTVGALDEGHLPSSPSRNTSY